MIPSLARYRIDRADGLTPNGPEKLIILVLTPNESRTEFPVAISKVDAMLIGLALQAAATEVQSDGC
jgi:hypothetical protein